MLVFNPDRTVTTQDIPTGGGGGGGSSTLAGLTDVSLSTPVINNILSYII